MPGWDDFKTRTLHSINQATQKAERMARASALSGRAQRIQQDRQAAIDQLIDAVLTGYREGEAGDSDSAQWPLEWRVLCKQIDSCDREIAALAQEIDQLRNPPAMHCPQCDSTVEQPAKFCADCGSPLESAEEAGDKPETEEGSSDAEPQ